MYRNDYLHNENVVPFINWVIERINNDKFNHKYIQKRPKGNLWECKSIYNAFENYNWNFKCELPTKEILIGNTFNESEEVLSKISINMRKAFEIEDVELFKAYCISVLHWGGVLKSNREKINSMVNPIEYFLGAVNKIDPKTVSLNDNFNNIIMNSGFTKIYSLLIDNFMIYDGRVGAALGLLVRTYLEEQGVFEIPVELQFAFKNPKVSYADKDELNKRNPSNNIYKFKKLTNNSKLHINNNIRANWLCYEVAKRSKFSQHENSIRAFESALFMIGYDIRQ